MYVDVVVALNTPIIFSYLVPSPIENEIAVGAQVSVPFGKSRIYSAIVIELHHTEPTTPLKELINVIDRGVTTAKQLQLWHWLCSYYMVTLGEVALTFLPPTLKRGEKLSGGMAEEGLQKICREKKVGFISLSPLYNTLESIEELTEKLKGAKAKQRAISNFIALILEQKESLQQFEIERKRFIELGNSENIIASLIKMEIFTLSYRQIAINLGDEMENHTFSPPKPSEECVAAVAEIQKSQEKHQTTLFHHNNPQFKQEIVVEYLSQLLQEQEGEVLYLLPDKHQAKERYNQLKKLFGGCVINNFGDKTALKRGEDYNKVAQNNSTLLIVATRNGIGLPYKNLRGVVVDCENEISYSGSQFELQYNGRDSAIYLAYIHQCKTLLCSEYPSFESYTNSVNGKFGLVERLESRKGKIALIDRSTIGRKEELESKDGIPQRRYISKLLINEIEKRLARGEVSFIYQNRKGFSTVVRCKECGYIVMCKNCNVPLTYHKSSDTMRCRYCSAAHSRVEKCPECSSYNIHPQGIGTENVEQRIQELFPLAKVARVDGDVAEKWSNFTKNCNLIINGEIDIVVGTQMFTKLPPINNLTLIGVVNGDNIFSFPDYRSTEKGFATLSTLYNRLANGENSLMVVQMSENRDITAKILKNSFNEVYRSEIANRELFGYPPFTKIILLTLRHRSARELDIIAKRCEELLRTYFKDGVIGPFAPQVDKIKKEYIAQLMIKVKSNESLARAKKEALNVKNRVKAGSKEVKIELVTY